jgi:ABC-2 type transport system permease protein
MGGLIKAEFRKTLSLKAWWGLLIPAVLLSFLFSLGWGAVTNDFATYLGSSDAELLTSALGMQVGELPVGLLALGRGINVGILFPILFGVFALAGEYTKKTIATTFLTAPNRVSALTAKMITYVVWGAVYGVVIVASAALGTVITVSPERMPSSGQWLAVLGAGVLATTLATLFGIGVGAVWRSVVGSMVTLIVWMLLLENVLVIIGFLWWKISWFGAVLPNATVDGIVGAVGAQAFGAAGVRVPGLDRETAWVLQYTAGAPGAVSWWASALVFGGWTMLFFLGGWAANQRRDIT